MSSTDSFAHYPDSRPPSVFERFGYGREDILSRLERNWYEMFEGPNKIYWESDDGLGYVMDTGNNDVRTEGMSYAMMLAVQYDRRDVLGRIWGRRRAPRCRANPLMAWHSKRLTPAESPDSVRLTA